jgi:regulatory protein
VAAAQAAAVALMSRREFCSPELSARLAGQGFEPAAIETCLAELRQRRYLDDERYARLFVSTHARRGQGPVRIRHELTAVGLSAETAETALAEHGGWAVQAQQVRARRFGAALPRDWAEKGRQVRFLQYRGFSNEDIRSALGTDPSADFTAEP